MTVAQRKKQEHIVDHLLYCLQMEDFIRAAQFQPTVLQQWAINSPLPKGPTPWKKSSGS